MKVLAITQSLDPIKGGGMGMAVCDLHRAMANTCDAPTVVIGIDGHYVATSANFQVRWFEAVGPAGAYYNSKLGEAVNEEANRADFIHLHGFFTFPMYVGWKAARARKKPLVRHVHGILEPWGLSQSRMKKKMARWFFEDAAIRDTQLWRALTTAEAEQIRQNGGRGKIVVVPTGIDLGPIDAEPVPAKSRKTLLFLSRVHKKKGLDLLLPAWAKVHGKFPDWNLAVAGKDEDGTGGKIQQFIVQNNLAGSVEWLGPIPQDRKFHLIKSASAFVLPSYSEGFSMGILEAMACSLPVLCTEACHFPEVQTHAGGEVCEVNQAGLERALEKLLGAGDLELQQRGEDARKFVESKYTWESLSRELYEACLEL
jgi:glycosyltransferase involved in cell wall biosynthesis